MNVTLLTYATTYNHYYYYQQQNAVAFNSYGDFTTIYTCNENSIAKEYIEKYKHILQCKDGSFSGIRAGFWLWKPYLIKRMFDKMQDGDILVYCDSTIAPLKSIKPIFEVFENQSIIPFMVNDGLGDEREACKRDALILMNCDTEKYWSSPVSGQLNASHIMFKKDRISSDFVNEYLVYAQDERIITDMENTLGKPNYPMFVCHRHDQTIYSLLIKRYGYKIFHDLTQYGNPFRLPEEHWGQLFFHQR